MLNFYDTIRQNPDSFKQLNCGDNLVTLYNCPLKNKFQDVWSNYNYVAYVMEGRKTWHTAQASFDLQKGTCVFIRKGASIVEQFFDATFCLVLFFLPDEYICEVLKSKMEVLPRSSKASEPVISIGGDPMIDAFFNSMMPFFTQGREPDSALLELKFRELILTIADNPGNSEILTYFRSLANEPQAVTLQRVMEENFCFNLGLEAFAKLSNRSLSAFKRDFQKHFDSTPGRWLIEKRLHHAHHLLSHTGKPVSEVAFESGFENPSHFSRAFRALFGKSPVSMKRELQA